MYPVGIWALVPSVSGIGQYLSLQAPIVSDNNFKSIGYKARTHLTKSLQTRCKAIRSATDAYNRAAHSLTPPRLPLDWAQVLRYSFLDTGGKNAFIQGLHGDYIVIL